MSNTTTETETVASATLPRSHLTSPSTFKETRIATLPPLISDLACSIHDLKSQTPRHGSEDHILTRMRVVALNDMQRRLKEIAHLTSQQQLRLAFIGPVGVGKTTLICDLLGLRVKERKGAEATFRKVLTTASGRTTACEVRLLVRDAARFDVQYHAEGDFLAMLEEFCLYYWRLAGHDLDEQVDPPASEVQKVLRNLVDLKGDAATQLAQEHHGFDTFFAEVLARYQAQDRTQTELTYAGTPGDALKWVAAHFKKLNLGTLNGFSLPKTISISLPRTLLAIPEHLNLDCVIDTKGLENATSAREDIDDYLRSGDYLCIFVDRFADAPNSAVPTLQRHLTRESVDIEQRCMLIVNARQGEAIATTDDDGDYVDEATGYQIKAAQIGTAIAGAKIHRFLPDHILFHNPHQYFESDSEVLRFKRDVLDDDVTRNAQGLWAFVERVVVNRNAYLHDQVEALKKRLQGFQSSEVIDPGDLMWIHDTHARIQQRSHQFVPNASSLASLTRALQIYHVSTFRAINNRYGRYGTADVYYEAGEVSEQFFRNVSEACKLDVERELHHLRAKVTNSDLKACLAQYIDKLDADYQQAAKAVRQLARACVEEQIHPQQAASPSEADAFWIRVIGRWGAGPGYRDDVLRMYIDALAALDRGEPAVYQEFWRREVSEPLLNNLFTA